MIGNPISQALKDVLASFLRKKKTPVKSLVHFDELPHLIQSLGYLELIILLDERRVFRCGYPESTVSIQGLEYARSLAVTRPIYIREIFGVEVVWMLRPSPAILDLCVNWEPLRFEKYSEREGVVHLGELYDTSLDLLKTLPCLNESVVGCLPHNLITRTITIIP